MYSEYSVRTIEGYGVQYRYVQPKGTPYSVSFRQFRKNSILTRPDQRLLVIPARRTKEEKNLFLTDGAILGRFQEIFLDTKRNLGKRFR